MHSPPSIGQDLDAFNIKPLYSSHSVWFNKSKLKPSVHIDLTNPIDTHLHVGKVVSPQCEISNDHVKSTVGDGHPKKHVSFADAEKAAGGEECLYVLGQNVFLLAKVTE